MTPPLGAWELTGTPVPLPGGHRNAVLRVGKHVLKSTRRSEAAVTWLLPLAELMQTCGLMMPRPVRSQATGTFIVDGWTCEPFVPGVPTAPRDIADRMTAFHRAAAHLPQRDGFIAARDLGAEQCGGDIDLDGLPPALASAMLAAWDALPDDLTVVHGDLNATNILTDDTGQVTLIDWDEARRDAPAFDLVTWTEQPPQHVTRAALAWEIACSWQLEPDHARALIPAFKTAMAPDKG
ncbi:MAG: phosphotransferase [Tateyamaria sp.]